MSAYLARVSVHYSNCVSPGIYYLYICFFPEDLEAPTPIKKVHFEHDSCILQKHLSIAERTALLSWKF